MPTQKIIILKHFEAWSYSRRHDYQECPRKSYLKYLAKLPEPENAAMAAGNEVHKACEAYVLGRLPADPVPPRLANFEAEFKAVRRIATVRTEEQWAFTRDWKPTGWFDKDAWCRSKADLHWLVPATRTNGCTVFNVDHKTGKEYESHADQEKLYALTTFLKYPEAEWVRTAYWYLDLGKMVQGVYHRDQVPALQAEEEARTAPMLADRTFAPRPSDKCRFCHYSAAKNGPCEF